MDRARIHRAVDEMLDALDEYRRAPLEEELVRVRDLPIESRAVASLMRSGALRTVRLGRETWTRRTWLAAAVDSLPAAHVVAAETLADDEGAEVVAAARRRALRSVGGSR